jgi:gluconolactonase
MNISQNLRAGALIALLCANTAALAKENTYTTIGKIERNDPALDQLIPAGAKIEKLAEGFTWSEGPVWIRKGGYLVFSDVPQNVVHKWEKGKGISVYVKPSGYTGAIPRGGEPGSNGLTVDSNGRLVLCEHGDRRVARLDGRSSRNIVSRLLPGTKHSPAGTPLKTTLMDRYNGKRFNSPNDLCFKSNGDLYFTDPPYGLLGENHDVGRELPFCGVYRLSRSGEFGRLTLLTDELTFPNGIAFSPDEKTLYVAVSDPKKAIWMSYPVKADGTLDKGRVFFDSTPMVGNERPGLPDGLKVDNRGNLFATGPGGVLIFSPEGKHLGTIATGVPTANCAWGEDGSVLYITANHWLCRVKTSTRGKMP